MLWREKVSLTSIKKELFAKVANVWMYVCVCWIRLQKSLLQLNSWAFIWEIKCTIQTNGGCCSSNLTSAPFQQLLLSSSSFLIFILIYSPYRIIRRIESLHRTAARIHGIPTVYVYKFFRWSYSAWADMIWGWKPLFCAHSV